MNVKVAVVVGATFRIKDGTVADFTPIDGIGLKVTIHAELTIGIGAGIRWLLCVELRLSGWFEATIPIISNATSVDWQIGFRISIFVNIFFFHWNFTLAEGYYPDNSPETPFMEANEEEPRMLAAKFVELPAQSASETRHYAFWVDDQGNHPKLMMTRIDYGEHEEKVVYEEQYRKYIYDFALCPAKVCMWDAPSVYSIHDEIYYREPLLIREIIT